MEGLLVRGIPHNGNREHHHFKTAPGMLVPGGVNGRTVCVSDANGPLLARYDTMTKSTHPSSKGKGNTRMRHMKHLEVIGNHGMSFPCCLWQYHMREFKWSLHGYIREVQLSIHHQVKASVLLDPALCREAWFFIQWRRIKK